MLLSIDPFLTKWITPFILIYVVGTTPLKISMEILFVLQRTLAAWNKVTVKSVALTFHLLVFVEKKEGA